MCYKMDYNISDIITGERIQELCDVYLAPSTEFFDFNPRISPQKHKHLLFKNIPEEYYNPMTIFVYGNCLKDLYEHINKFKNSFILVTHNSDENITEKYKYILDSDKIIAWYAQNGAINHEKFHTLPIGIANSMWKHGNLENMLVKRNKSKDIYCNFKKDTNYNKRNTCVELIKDKVEFVQTLPYKEYIETLSEYKFAICPEGNGFDTHRFWECQYLKVLPICIKSDFTSLLAKKFPVILLDKWDDLNPSSLVYEEKLFDSSRHFLKLSNYIHILTRPRVVLVCTGVFQTYINDCIEQLILWANKVTVLTERKFFQLIRKAELIDINTISTEETKKICGSLKLDNQFRGGFWLHCMTRFFYLLDYMKSKKIERIVHIENDIMVYTNVSSLTEKLDKMSIVLDGDRGIASFMFIPNEQSLEKCLTLYQEGKNDMEWLGRISRDMKEEVNILPIIHKGEKLSSLYDKMEGIFDAAAMGQYIGGVDPRNIPGDTIGLISNECIIKYNLFSFRWKKINDLWVPFLIDKQTDREIRIYNLHIHSKRLSSFMSTNPEQNRIISI